MKSILEACTPRSDLLKGTFNPEVFTASLGAVMQHYRGEKSGIHCIYTNTDQFFNEATYPTEGLKMVLSEVFGRLSGDSNTPAIHRLETAFGGGKTHTLIACAHLGFKGRDLKDVATGIVDGIDLHEPGEVAVVGVVGDELPVHKPVGAELVPYTLWGEIAFQIGGEALYQQVLADAESPAAPGKAYFDSVLGGRKALLMLDELAQYAARLAAANPRNSDQLAAFLMGLHGYARSNPGIAVVLTLAGAKDAFANQTVQLATLLGEVTGEKISQDGALGIGQKAVANIASVVARDATAVVPVQAAEISRVLAKRLFDRIDDQAAAW
jgi:predicted AAA+ superfamily ATPase